MTIMRSFTFSICAGRGRQALNQIAAHFPHEFTAVTPMASLQGVAVVSFKREHVVFQISGGLRFETLLIVKQVFVWSFRVPLLASRMVFFFLIVDCTECTDACSRVASFYRFSTW